MTMSYRYYSYLHEDKDTIEHVVYCIMVVESANFIFFCENTLIFYVLQYSMANMEGIGVDAGS